METTLRVIIQTPDTVHFDGQAAWVRLETEGGELEIHPQHVSTMGSFIFSPVVVHNDNQLTTYYLRQGVMRMDNEDNTLSILAFSSEKESEITESTIKDYMDFVMGQLESGDTLSTMQAVYLQDQHASLEKLLHVAQNGGKKKA